MKNIFDFAKKKMTGQKISMITCYDYTCAKILANTSIDCILVGDSVAMTMHGFEHTLFAEIELLAIHTQAVKRGAPDKFIIGDMPFLSYRKSKRQSMDAVERLIKAGAQAIKLEGAAGNIALIKHLVESGIPVMGHLGLTAQMLHTLGGYKVQGKTDQAAAAINNDAYQLQEAGCFALVLECMPSELANTITQRLSIPTIGIGAGSDTDGQVLVWQDMLGLNLDFKPKFVKAYLPGALLIEKAIEDYICEVNSSAFPEAAHCY
jgi:3-methyl-2-oxobutanoate hydroxymethyltransferase